MYLTLTAGGEGCCHLSLRVWLLFQRSHAQALGSSKLHSSLSGTDSGASIHPASSRGKAGTDALLWCWVGWHVPEGPILSAVFRWRPSGHLAASTWLKGQPSDGVCWLQSPTRPSTCTGSGLARGPRDPPRGLDTGTEGLRGHSPCLPAVPKQILQRTLQPGPLVGAKAVGDKEILDENDANPMVLAATGLGWNLCSHFFQQAAPLAAFTSLLLAISWILGQSSPGGAQ